MGQYTKQFVNFLASNKNSNRGSIKLATYDGTYIVCGDLKLEPDDVLINEAIKTFEIGGIYLIYTFSDERYLVLERVVEVSEFITRQSV